MLILQGSYVIGKVLTHKKEFWIDKRKVVHALGFLSYYEFRILFFICMWYFPNIWAILFSAIHSGINHWKWKVGYGHEKNNYTYNRLFCYMLTIHTTKLLQDIFQQVSWYKEQQRSACQVVWDYYMNSYEWSIFLCLWHCLHPFVIPPYFFFSYPFLPRMCRPSCLPPQFWTVTCLNLSAVLVFDIYWLPSSSVPPWYPLCLCPQFYFVSLLLWLAVKLLVPLMLWVFPWIFLGPSYPYWTSLTRFHWLRCCSW